MQCAAGGLQSAHQKPANRTVLELQRAATAFWMDSCAQTAVDESF